MGLLLALCAPRTDPARVAALARRPIDAGVFTGLAERHRVGALARAGLAAAGVAPPAGTGAAFARWTHDTARRGLALAAETARLDAALEAAGLAAVVLKGAPLAMLAHGTLATKQARDIDLLVAREALDEAAAVLARAGYRRSGEDGADRVALADWHRFAKDSVWRHPERRVTVELHTDLTDHPRFLLPGLGVDAAAHRVALAPGVSVRGFALEPLFAYLCVHGAISGWRRLKWLADLAGLIRDLDADAVARLHAAAIGLGAGRAATQGVALAHDLLGTPLPTEVAGVLAADRRSRLLVAGARRLLVDTGVDDPAERAGGTLPLHLMTMLLIPARGYRRSILRRYLRPHPGGPRWLPFPLARALRMTGKASGAGAALDEGHHAAA